MNIFDSHIKQTVAKSNTSSDASSDMSDVNDDNFLENIKKQLNIIKKESFDYTVDDSPVELTDEKFQSINSWLDDVNIDKSDVISEID